MFTQSAVKEWLNDHSFPGNQAMKVKMGFEHLVPGMQYTVGIMAVATATVDNQNILRIKRL